jgi:putative PIN family toxin of toxin-antitoxin system
MKVVIDINVMLVAVSSRSTLYWIFQRLTDGDYTLCLTTEILAEYAEKMEEHMSVYIADTSLETILRLPNIEKVNVYFKWNLITNDADDNKYSDCAIAANADYIVTHDTDFNILKRIDFPKVKVISAAEFREVLEKSKSNHNY